MFQKLKKMSLASSCLIFMAITVPLVELDIDLLQSQRDQLMVNNIRLEINMTYSELLIQIPSIPDDVIKLHKTTLNDLSTPVANFKALVKIIDKYLERLKLIKIALLVGPVIIFTLSEIYRVENEPRISKYMLYIGIATFIILLCVRKYIWWTLSSQI